MPLRKPTSIPKIPKTRKKKPHACFDSIPVKKPDKIEYTCKAFFKYNELQKKQLHVLAIETVVEFTAFAYEVSVEVIQDKNVINLIIMGLRAKMDAIPQIMPARKEVYFEDLFGDYIINIYKQDGAINTADYHFNIYKKEILLKNQYKPKKKNNRLFCEFKVAKEEFSFLGS
jgi:hypothetical protein